MPNPIPSWDLARRLVKYVGFRQINGQPPTFREASRTLGVGRERILKIMEENQIIYKILESKDRPLSDRLALHSAPLTLVGDAGLSPTDLLRSFEEASTGDYTNRQVRQRRLNKKQKEAQRINTFWQGEGA